MVFVLDTLVFHPEHNGVANRLDHIKIDELWAAYQVHQSVHEVARKCGIHHRTVERYRRIERWDERLEEIRAKAQKKADYTLAQAMTDSLKLVRAYKQKMSDAIASKVVCDEDVTASELEKIVKLEAFVLGGVESRQEIVGRFADWSDAELEEYASSGKLPARSGSRAA
jgi:hypothetical protein